MSNANISARLIELIEAKTKKSRRYKELEAITGLIAERWSAFCLGRQRPTSEMLESIFKAWPEHAFWLATGVQDFEFGHIAPNGTNYPVVLVQDGKDASTQFFRASILIETMRSQSELDFKNSIAPIDYEETENEKQSNLLRDNLEGEKACRSLKLLEKQYENANDLEQKNLLVSLMRIKTSEMIELPDFEHRDRLATVMAQNSKLREKHEKLMASVTKFNVANQKIKN